MRRSAGASAALLAAAFLLPACSGPEDQPGGVTADEARQLNAAAAMLDDNSMDADRLANTQADR